ncbi:hypothetical protein C479_07333 [Halovivax asiaticus JCM 14624]|uniref:Uncharacterized protein n=2 Tax=Halovivax asiaticus TaxID=332953 RepID=M0BKV5_9EURY|nr:hypothetical protein C479_07333 [Halovivax asiaticus JCM 14624]
MKSRLTRFDNTEWNNPWYVPLGGAVLAILGVLLGYRLAAAAGATGLGEYGITVLCLALTMAVGFGGLAILDMRNRRQ